MIDPAGLKPWIITVTVAVASAISFAAGYMTSNWRDGAQIERLGGQNTALLSANDKCAADVKNIRTAMAALTAEAAERVKQAEEAMKQVEPQVKERTVTITKIKTLPPVPLNKQCEAIKEEQLKYVQMRRGA